MSLYTRQYTNDVGWQNEPSTATPINSTNLNKMDDAIGNVDAAVKSAFDSVETSLANAGGVSMGNKITSFSTTYNSMETDIAFDDSIANHDGAVFFLTSDDEGAENQNGWKIRVNWVNGSSTTITRLPVLNVSPQTMSDVFTDAVAEGDVVIARLVIEDPADSSTWRCDLLAHISASANGGGIGAECSGHAITGLASNNEAINAGILFDDDIENHDTHIFFLTSEYAVPEKSDAPYYWRLWVRYKIGSTTVGRSIMIYDIAGNAFDDAIPVGNEFICQLHLVDPSDSDTWYVSELANISAGGGGGGTTVVANPSGPAVYDLEKLQVGSTIYAINAGNSAEGNKITSTSSSSGTNAFVTDISLDSGIAEHVNDVFFLTSECNAGASQYGWNVELQYTSGGGSSVITQLPLFGIGATSLMDMFSGAIHTGDIIVAKLLYSDIVSGYALYMLAFDELPTLASLTDTNISTPTDGQYLKYDSASNKWINASGGGGGASALTDLSDVSITTPMASQPLLYDNVSGKWANGGNLPIEYGGTGNADGYIRTGLATGVTAGMFSTAEGSNNSVTGMFAHAEGAGNTASNTSAHVGGNSSTASGSYSFAHGNNCTAGYTAQVAVGKYNDNKSTNILEVGIGTGTNAKANGLELDTSGNLKTAGTITNGKGVTVGDADVLLPATVGWTGKNLLENTASTTTINGVTFTVNSDKSVTVSTEAGGATGDTALPMDSDVKMEANKTYTVSKSVASDDCRVILQAMNGTSFVSNLLVLNNDSADYTPTFSNYDRITARLYVPSGKVITTPITFYPMIRLATVTDPTYEPYHKSVEECLEDINDKLSYLEQTVTLSTSSSTTVTFTDASITANSFIEYACSQWDLVPESITGAAGSCTIVLPKVDSAQSVTVRIYVR